MGEGSAVRGGIWEIFLGGGVVFWPSGGGKRFDLKGGERGGKFFFWPPSAAKKIPILLKKNLQIFSLFSIFAKFSAACGGRGGNSSK